MEKAIQKIIYLITIFIVFFGISSTVLAKNVLPDGLLIGDEDGLNVQKNGEYLVNIDDVMPGDQWEKNISIMNMEKNSPYRLSLQLSPAEVSGKLDFSKAIQMSLTYNDKVIYEGPASGISTNLNLQANPFDLGTFNPGDSKALKVNYSISGEYTKDDFGTKNTFDNIWTFTAVKTTKEEDPNANTKKPSGILPQTGDTKQVMTVICITLFIILIILFVWKKHQEEALE